MPSICLYFRIHIPYSLGPFVSDNTRTNAAIKSIEEDRAMICKLANECYLPANKLLLELINKHNGGVKVALSISGTAIELLEQYRPDVLDSFKQLAKTNCVEFLAETYYNSLSWLHSKKEFKRQVERHHQKIQEAFNCTPVVFRNTEFIYSNALALFMANMGYKGILCEGEQSVLMGRSCNQTYAAPGNGDFSVFLRNTRLSDDIAFRFDDKTWNEQPLTAEKFAGWIHDHTEDECTINIYFDYETIGVHKKSFTGIFEFLQNLPAAILADKRWEFTLPGEICVEHYPRDIFDSPGIISWQNRSADNCIWSENSMQRNSLSKVYNMENIIQKTNSDEALDYWGRLQSADHFFYMSSQISGSNNMNLHLNPYQSAAYAFERYKEMVTDFEVMLMKQGLDTFRNIYRYESVYNLFGG